MKLKFYGSMLVAMMLGFMASCSSDVEQPGTVDKNANLKLAAEPSIRVWSGNEFFTRDGAGTDTEDATEVVNAKYLNDEVEVNLAINDVHFEDGVQKYKVADLCSKLSIHLRSAQDVEITIPVSRKYYCDQDDLYIFNDNNEAYAFEIAENGVKLDIANTVVTLTVSYAPDKIVVTTSGMNKAVLDYCKEKNNDGLNFEVYNYYNRANMPLTDEDGNKIGGEITVDPEKVWTVSQLKAALDGSTIKFLNGTTPDYYINAFTGHTTYPGGGVALEFIDCYVTPIEEQIGDFIDTYYGPHFNGFDQNLIYSKKVREVSEKWPDDTTNITPENKNQFSQTPGAESHPTVPDHSGDE